MKQKETKITIERFGVNAKTKGSRGKITSESFMFVIFCARKISTKPKKKDVDVLYSGNKADMLENKVPSFSVLGCTKTIIVHQQFVARK